jgi:poly-gamma-glutamate synthesis protein (capsule biosynthesis protein)
MKISIAGDFCITSSHLNEDLLSERVKSLFNHSDINIVNLEGPIISEDNLNKIIKTGPHIHTSKEVLKYLKQLNTNVVTLANNHILDYGARGLETTIKECKQNNIFTVGGGINLKNASQPIILERNDIKIGIVNFCEKEWNIASDKTAGANPLDIIENIKQIQKTRVQSDFVVVIIHGGHEYYHLPSPRMVKQYRFFAENGADLIIGHHPHCISGYEIHKKVPIFYSLGNMIFTQQSNHKEWYTGLILQIDITKRNSIKWQLIPIKQSYQNFKLSLVSGREKDKILREIDELSKIINDDKKLNLHWIEFVEKWEDYVIDFFSPINIIPGKYIRAGLKRLGFNKILNKNRYLVKILNRIRCEAHYDLAKEALKSKIYKLK